MKREGKKNPILVYPGLRYTHKKLNFACKIFFFKKYLFEYENQFAIEKKNTKKFWGQFQNFCRRHQKMLVIQFPYMEIGLSFLSPPPHRTPVSTYSCNEWFYEVEYEDQICLPWPN